MDIKKLDSFVYFYNQLKGLVKPFYWLYGFVLLIPYFVHYKFFPDDYPTDFLKLGILLLIFIFFGYFILVSSLVVLFYTTSNFEKDKKNILLGGIFSIFPLFFISVELAGIWALFVICFIFVFYKPFEQIIEDLKSYKNITEYFGKNSANIFSLIKSFSKIFTYAFLFLLSGIFFLLELVIWSKFSFENIMSLILLTIILIIILIAQSYYFYQRRYDFTIAILLLTPVVFVVFFSDIHIHNLEKTFQQLNIASEKSRFYVNERIYKLLTAENSTYLSLCSNKIKIKGKKGCEEYYLVENLYVVWNSSKKIWVKTYKDGRLQIVPIPKKFLINEDIITTYGYKY